MPIALLSNETIDKIAAGEVVERPLNVVKELVENSIDSKASSITVEIKGGGIEMIRVTDNGSGIDSKECKNAFLRHATSKITQIEDLDTLVSLGFRGEALSSICAVSKTEMITKTNDSLLGTRVVVEGGKFLEQSDVGAPNGTTIIIRSLFYNTPARKKFLKTPSSEASMINDIMEKFALSNPNISFNLIINGSTKISTSGNGELKDVVYHLFGKDIYKALLPVYFDECGVKIYGFTAKPEFSYQQRNGEIYYINGRYVKSKILKTAIEEVYRNYLMQHRFPFCVLLIEVSADSIDVNVHPQKLEVKFSDNTLISDSVINALKRSFVDKELIPTVSLNPESEHITTSNTNGLDILELSSNDNKTFDVKNLQNQGKVTYSNNVKEQDKTTNSINDLSSHKSKIPEPFETSRKENFVYEKAPEYVQESLFEKKLLSDEALKEFRIIGHAFNTYWFLELDNELYIVDQHAAHEKVNYEAFLNRVNSDSTEYGQLIAPPIVIHLSPIETEALISNIQIFEKIGFEIDDFGMGSFAIRSIPTNLYGLEVDDLFHRLINELVEKEGTYLPTFICEKLASMACKASIKGGQAISFEEMNGLMKQLMTLDNPYNCPHGRPVLIKMSRTDLEKKFKRIV